MALEVSSAAGAVEGPLPEKPECQLATLAKDAPGGDDWLHEIKFDGYRMLAHVVNGKATFTSRNGHDWSARFPELAALLPQLPISEAVLDGEIVHILPTGVTSFGGLQKDLSEGATGKLVFYIFDLLYLNGFRLNSTPLLERKHLLEMVIDQSTDNRIRYSAHQRGHGPQFFSAAAAIPLEGIVSKQVNAPYHPGRSGSWLKVKAIGREELIVVGFTDPEGGRVGFGALLLGYYNPTGGLTCAGKVGTGYSDKVLTALRKRLDKLQQSEPTVFLPKGISRTGLHWVSPEIVVETSFTEWTSDGVLRHPVFLGIREDKPAKEVVLDKSLNPETKTTHWRKRKK